MIGTVIREAREARRMSQRELAKRLGLSNETIRQWEGGWSKPSEPRLPAIADALGVSVDELLREDQPAETEPSQPMLPEVGKLPEGVQQ